PGGPNIGLVDGQPYYVITTSSPFLIQLAATPADVTTHPNPNPPPNRLNGPNPVPLFADDSNTGVQSGQVLVREGIGGLQRGHSYFGKTDNGSQFQLSTKQDLSDTVGVTPTVSKGGPSHFFKAGLLFTPSSGTQDLRIDLIGPLPGGAQKL